MNSVAMPGADGAAAKALADHLTDARQQVPALAQVNEQGPDRALGSLPGSTNLATPVTPISLCCFSRLRTSCPTTMADSATV
jgi:hypothetical protein